MNEISEPDVRARLDALERRADNFEEEIHRLARQVEEVARRVI